MIIRSTMLFQQCSVILLTYLDQTLDYVLFNVVPGMPWIPKPKTYQTKMRPFYSKHNDEEIGIVLNNIIPASMKVCEYKVKVAVTREKLLHVSVIVQQVDMTMNY